MKANKELLQAEYSKVWKDQKMIDFCVNKVAAVAVLPSGEIVTVEKRKIEKDFCFGESGYDYDDAQKAAATARKSQGYFKRENLKPFDEWLKDLEDALDFKGNYALVINPKAYYSQTDDCKLASVEFVRFWEVIDACGGECHVDELPGKELTIRGCSRRIATNEEIRLIMDAYREARAAHEKKVDSYLKRFGTSKVNAWTYWREA